MESNGTLKFLKILVAILVLLNIGLMCTIWLKPLRGDLGMHHGHQEIFEYVEKELNMTPQQMQAYEKLRDWHHDSITVLRHQGHDLRNGLFGRLKSEPENKAVTDSIINLIAQNQKQIEELTYEHFRQVRALCDDKQKQRFDVIIDDVIKRMMHEGPPPGREEGPPPGGHDAPPHE